MVLSDACAFLVIQYYVGVCMSSYITGRRDKDDATVVQQLKEMHQVCDFHLRYLGMMLSFAFISSINLMGLSSFLTDAFGKV